MVPASLLCTEDLCPGLFNGWTELRPTLKIWPRGTLDRCYAAVLGLCRLQILCGQAGLWIAESQSLPLPFGASCWPRRPLIALPLLCRVYQQSLPPRQLSSLLLADLLRVYTEKRSQLCHSMSMKKSSMVFCLWSLKDISDLELLESQQPSPWFNFQRHWLNSQKAVIMLAVTKRAVPKKNKNSPPTNFYCLVTWEEKAPQREGRN